MEEIEMRIGKSFPLEYLLNQLNEFYYLEQMVRERQGLTDDFVVYSIFKGVKIYHTDSPDEVLAKVSSQENL